MSERRCTCGVSIADRDRRTRYCSRACKDKARWLKGHPLVNRCCPTCECSLAAKRSHAVYCSRRCKAVASKKRERVDGRAHAKDRARYAKESERRRRQASEWSRRNPELVRLKRWRRKARRLTQDCRRITERDWHRMMLVYRGRCAYCEADGPLHMDHVIPLSRGGRHAIGNVVPACPRCNLTKQSLLLIEWRARREGVIPSHPLKGAVATATNLSMS